MQVNTKAWRLLLLYLRLRSFKTDHNQLGVLVGTQFSWSWYTYLHFVCF